MTTSSIIDRTISNYYDKQLLTGRGYPQNYYKGRIFHSGSGWASGLTKLFKFVAPVFKRTGKYLLKKGVNTASNIISDSLEGTNLKEAAKRWASQAFDEMKYDMRKKIIKTIAPRVILKKN